MSHLEIEEIFGFDEQDLVYNRLGRLSQKQKEVLLKKDENTRKSQIAMGVLISLVIGGAILWFLISSLLPLFRGDVEISSVQNDLVFAGVVMFIFGVAAWVVWKEVRQNLNIQLDLKVRHAVGEVRFTFREREERNALASGGPEYKIVRWLEMKVGEKDIFSEVDERLPDVISDGEIWLFYFTEHPYKILSAEKME